MATRRITLVRPSDMFRMFEDSMTNFMGDIGVSTIPGNTHTEVNVKEFTDRYELSAKVPGYLKEDIGISFQDNMIIIEGEMKHEEEKEEGSYVMQEFVSGSFKRGVTLNSKVDSDNVEAELENGILKIKVPKLPEVMPKKISIK
jgi:HSP20 family protein